MLAIAEGIADSCYPWRQPSCRDIRRQSSILLAVVLKFVSRAARLAVSLRMKKYWAARRAAKAKGRKALEK
jgi:hypothetical protein